MSAARTARRRRRQHAIGFRHLALIGHGPNNRPIYHRASLGSVSEAIARERWLASQEAKRKAKKK